MKLMYGKLSPFVRKVMISAIEVGLDDKIELLPTAVGQGKTNDDLIELNPTGKIPTLIADDGEAIFDSLVIIDYFDSISGKPHLIPSDATARRKALRLNTIADGILIAGVLAKVEGTRAAEKQWPEWTSAQWNKVVHCIDALEKDIGSADAGVTIGDIGPAAALGWLDVRAPEEKWRDKHPRLAKWFEAFSERESFKRTVPTT